MLPATHHSSNGDQVEGAALSSINLESNTKVLTLQPFHYINIFNVKVQEPQRRYKSRDRIRSPKMLVPQWLNLSEGKFGPLETQGRGTVVWSSLPPSSSSSTLSSQELVFSHILVYSLWATLQPYWLSYLCHWGVCSVNSLWGWGFLSIISFLGEQFTCTNTWFYPSLFSSLAGNTVSHFSCEPRKPVCP